MMVAAYAAVQSAVHYTESVSACIESNDQLPLSHLLLMLCNAAITEMKRDLHSQSSSLVCQIPNHDP